MGEIAEYMQGTIVDICQAKESVESNNDPFSYEASNTRIYDMI